MSVVLTIRSASRDEFATVIKWASDEGWNPGIDDLNAFYAVDPEGFIMGWIEDEPVSSLSVVRYGDDFGFLGFYIVHPDHRGKGIGFKTWEAGLDHLKGRSIALDGVVDQQDNYTKSGFDYVGRNIRYSGVPSALTVDEAQTYIRPVRSEDLPALRALDQRCFGCARENFIADWCGAPEVKTRRTFVAKKYAKLIGFGTIRQCASGYKIGPLFCESADIAALLFAKLVESTEANATISIDVPAANNAAIHLAEGAGLESAFETARMVRGTVPPIDWNAVYGITSFELG